MGLLITGLAGEHSRKGSFRRRNKGETKMKGCTRLGIILCYDKAGIIDDYIPYMLHDLVKNLDRLVVVFHGTLTPQGRKRLLGITKDVVVKENEGYDIGAWKFAMTQYLGWETVDQYDEVVLLNDTFFGPFYPFQTVFEQMAEQEADFWGLTAHGECTTDMGNHWHAHLQSYFLVIRKNMHCSFEFKEYWEKQKLPRSFWEAVNESEVVFTHYFEKRGFTWKAYIDMSDLDGKFAMNHYAFNAEELLQRGYPILKRKMFTEPMHISLSLHNGEDYKYALQYIQKHYSYDVSMIWQNVLRIYNIGAIHNAMALDYVIDNVSQVRQTQESCQAAVVLHITYTEKLERYLPYIQAIPSWMDVIITTISKEKKVLLQEAFAPHLGTRMTVLCIQNRGRDLSAMLVAARPYLGKYDYFCFCHDKISKQMPFSYGKYFEKTMWENMLSSTAYVENIISRFAEEPQLGLLAVPYHIGGFLPHFASHLWTDNYANTVSLLQKLDVEVTVSAEIPPLSLGTAFWCRTDALRKLFEYPWEYEDFPKEPMKVDGQLNHALERCFPFVAQDAGYYTATVMTPEYAGIMVNAYKYLALNAQDSKVNTNFLCMTDENMPEVGVQGALHLLRLTLRQYFRKGHRKKA